MKYLKAYETYKADNLAEVRHMLEIMSNFEGNLWTDIAKAKLNALTEVEVVPLSELFDKKTITEIKKRVRPVPKECYSNSFHTAEFLSEFDVEYCEGYIVFMGIPIEHAFNKIGDKYFDVTQELAFPNRVTVLSVHGTRRRPCIGWRPATNVTAGCSTRNSSPTIGKK